jgi:hypothetical protein
LANWPLRDDQRRGTHQRATRKAQSQAIRDFASARKNFRHVTMSRNPDAKQTNLVDGESSVPTDAEN